MLLENDQSCPALNAHERSHLRTILQADYKPSRLDLLGEERTKRQRKKEYSEIWRARKNFDLNKQNQVIRNADDEHGPRVAACTYDAANYIIDRHRELQHILDGVHTSCRR